MIAAHFLKPNRGIKAAADLSLTIILQIFGVASLWGYSDILGLRRSASGESMWRSITIVFMFLSGVRVFSVLYFSNRPGVPKFILAIKDPAYGIRQYDGSMVSTVGILYGLLLDFVLQILGTAAVWGASEIVGLRNASNRQLWGALTGLWSCVSLFRYIWRAHKVLSPGQWLKVPPMWPTGVIDSFGTSFCSLQASLYLWSQWRNQRTYERIISLATSSQPTPTAPPTHAGYVDTLALVAGWLLHLSLRTILQVLGAGGAVWGISEVLTLRTPSNGPLFVVISLFVMVSSLVYYLLGTYEKCLGPIGRQQDMRVCDSGLQGEQLQLTAITSAPDPLSSQPMIPSPVAGLPLPLRTGSPEKISSSSLHICSDSAQLHASRQEDSAFLSPMHEDSDTEHAYDSVGTCDTVY